MFKRGADRAGARPTFPRRKLSAAEMFFNSRGHQGRPDKQRPSRPSKDRRSDERVKPSHGERSLSRNKSSPRVRSFGVPAARSSRSQIKLSQQHARATTEPTSAKQKPVRRSPAPLLCSTRSVHSPSCKANTLVAMYAQLQLYLEL